MACQKQNAVVMGTPEEEKFFKILALKAENANAKTCPNCLTPSPLRCENCGACVICHMKADGTCGKCHVAIN
ncbi:MAG: hypothetical protein UU87_C0001G0026 [Parcubacteria group bacterium GW2011_GWA2_42_11]|nr:MAG: hypothetical protein UU87_C0001G0026 [Parcubacteria group bacterium GW2011_GWA2_42_11]